MSITAEQLTTCWERHRNAFVAHARTYVADADAAEDLTQDLITEALAARSTYRGPADPRCIRTWLLGILNNLCRQFHRRHTREQSQLDRLVTHLHTDRGHFPRGAAYDAAIWLLRLANLDSRQTAIVRFRLDGHTLQAIATHYAADVRTIRHQLTAAVAALRQCPYNDLAVADLGQHQRQPAQRVTNYRRPQRTGAGLARMQLARLK